jgi:hypothetical protein
MTRDGLRPQYQAMGELSVEQMPPMLAQMYAAVSPDSPEHFKVVFGRLRSSWTSGLALSMVRLGEVSTPTLVMMGDGDIPSVEHDGNIYGRLADAQLAIVPGTSHALTMEKPDLVNRLILDFSQILRRPRCFSWGRRWSLNERLPASAARGPQLAPGAHHAQSDEIYRAVIRSAEGICRQLTWKGDQQVSREERVSRHAVQFSQK